MHSPTGKEWSLYFDVCQFGSQMYARSALLCSRRIVLDVSEAKVKCTRVED